MLRDIYELHSHYELNFSSAIIPHSVLYVQMCTKTIFLQAQITAVSMYGNTSKHVTAVLCIRSKYMDIQSY